MLNETICAQKSTTQAKSYVTIAIAAISAICLTQEYPAFYYFGVLGATLLIITTAFSPWLGVLALFPLTFALPPAPTTITITEILFTILLAAIFISAFIGELLRKHKKSQLKIYGYALALGIFLVILNLSVAMKNSVPLLDWVRGVIPFLFIFLFLPIAVLVEDNESRIRCLGSSVGLLIFMSASYIVFYYFYYDLWQPYWIISVDSVTTKILESEAIHMPDAIGPMRDRITMQVAQATDALLPVGLVAGIVLATLTKNKVIAGVGLFLALTCMLAVLITFTRSMLLSSLLAILAFTIFVIFFHKKLRAKLFFVIIFVFSAGSLFIFATGMQEIWIGRVSKLLEVQIFEKHSPAEAPQPAIATVKTEIKGVDVPPTPTAPHNNDIASALTAPPRNNEAPLPAAVPPAVEALNDTKIVSELTEENTKKPVTDVNVSSRLHEYSVAWQMFLANPTLGKGFGVKHQMQWEISEGSLRTESVGYVHNWPFYMLMVGGICGLAIYTFILLGPMLFRLTSVRSDSLSWTMIRTALITMSVYASFFAVFRLITFNLLIAAIWGVVFAHISTKRLKYNLTDSGAIDLSRNPPF